MNNSHYDHEQDERDYYDQQSEKHLNGCLYDIKGLVVMIILFLIGMMISGCASVQQPPATTSYGTVIDVEGETIWVVFDVVNRKPGDKASNRFHIPGHRYSEGDYYPDPYKDPELGKLIYSPRPLPPYGG